MFTPSAQIASLSWDAAGSKSLVVPGGMTAARLYTSGAVAYALGATASPAGMRISGSPERASTEVIGVAEGTTIAFYGAAGAALQITWGVGSGSASDQGPPGPAGPAGPQGASGSSGSAGAQGAQGLSVLNGAGAPSNALGSNGEFYIDTTANAIYGPKAANAWGVATPLVGPQGPAGATGSTGAAGAAGGQGPQGVQGPAGPAGAGITPNGYGNLSEAIIAGIQAAGVNWIYVVNPNGDLRSNINAPAGLSGDMARHVIGWNQTDAKWSDYGQFTGLQGPVGPAGAQGPQGSAGPAGSAGATGPSGRTILNGAGAPGAGVGTAGDFYVDTTNSRFYGPKAGTWPGGYVTIIGTQGPAGPAGATGAAGAAGAAGGAGPAGVGVPVGGTTGQALVKSSGSNYATEWATVGGGGGGAGYPKANAISRFYNDFVTAGALTGNFADGMYCTAVGTGAAISSANDQGTIAPKRRGAGFMEISTGSVANGYGYWKHFLSGSLTMGQAKESYRTALGIGALSDNTNSFDLNAAYASAPLDPSTAIGVYVRYNHAINGGKWQIRVKSSVADNSYDTGITVAINQMYAIEFLWNAAGTQVTIVINSTSFGPYNWADGSIGPPSLGLLKLAGTTARQAYVDFVEVVREWNTQRLDG